MIPVPSRPRFYAVVLRRPRPATAWTISVVAFTLVAMLNIGVLGGFLAGIAYLLPMCLCLWTRNRLILYLMALAGSVLACDKTFGATGDSTVRIVTWSFQLINIWIPTFAFHLAIYSFDRLDLKRKLLLDANEELDSANHELATREQEVLQQNKTLHAQTEELERQAEELRQGAEELEQQTVELHTANDELTRRERGLQTLLESARWLRSDLSERDVMSAICQAAVQVMEAGVTAAAIVHSHNGQLALRGHYGFGVHGTLREEVPFASTFAALVIGRRQTAFIADTQARPDLLLAQPGAGRPFRSLLSTPLTLEGRVIGAVEVYAPQPREWTDGEFKVIEWLSAQCSLAIQAIEYQQEVLVKRRQAEEASIQKTRFLAAVSHDVRTPVNAISLMADLIEQAALQGKDPALAQGELPLFARDLKASARSLVELVSDVLDLARLDTGKNDVQISEFPLHPLLENEIRQFEPAAADKNLRLVLHPLPEDLHLRTDRMKLARIVANLLGNAVKFTDAGGIDLRGELTTEGSLRLSISDTGVGMSSEALPRIFDEFYQIQNPERDRNKGAGLGLAICKRLVDSLRCELSVESRLGVGTTFTMLLPAALVASNARPGRPVAPDPPRLRQLDRVNILLVEDHDITRKATARLLASHGARVLEARTSREALHYLMHDQPNVMLLDLMLPDGDGTEILKQLQVYRRPTLRCILAVSGDVRDARVKEVTGLGADGLLAKPLDIEKLLFAITSRLFPV